MRAMLVAARAAAAAIVLLVPFLLVAAEFKLPAADATPAELVKAALESELDGPSEVRKTLLDRALKLDPSFAPARWQSGFVKYDGQWLALEEVARRAADDKQLAEYRRRRDAAVDSAQSQRELARWCRKNRWVEEARIHWAKVLEFDPQDAEAIRGLGLQLHNGRLLTKQQIIDERHAAELKEQHLRHWKPLMEGWLESIEKGGREERNAALTELRQLNDPDALDAVVAVFVVNADEGMNPQLAVALAELLGRIQTQEATQLLVNLALSADPASTAACDVLKQKPLFAYVPQLIASMPLPASLDVSYQTTLLPNGAVMLTANIDRKLGDSEQSVSIDTQIAAYSAIISRMHPEKNRMFRDPALDIPLAQSVVRDIQRNEAEVRRADAFDKLRQEQISQVLARLTGAGELEDRNEWQNWWNEYTETYTPSYQPEKPYGRTFTDLSSAIWLGRVTRVSCFPAGTAVLTADGRRPIETLQSGDRVICEDAKTGELVTRPIQGTTLRPAAPLVKITLGSQSISATRGHPFWVNGQGWTMAKHLKVGQILHGIDGAVRIDAIEEAPAREAYNLVVGDYGTYFVGETRVLVHDNTPLAETTAVVPGLELAATP